PQLIVNARRHGGILLVADGLALASDPGADERHLAKFARTDKLGSAQDVRSAAALRPGLDDALVLARRLDHAPALDDVVRDRLLDVDVLAGLAGPDRRQRVPVVRRRDDERVNVLLFEDLADVLLGLRRPLLLVLDDLDGGGQDAGIGIDDAGDLSAVKAAEAGKQ